MNQDGVLKQTPLHALHQELGATMSPFGGWDMPLWYRAGAIKEHLAVVQAAGAFDTSHMDVIRLAGDSARDFLNYAFTRDIAELPCGRCGYGAFLDGNGHSIDDGIVYPFEDSLAVVVNASMSEPVRAHLTALPGSDGVEILPVLPRPAKLDIQGPDAPRIVAALLDASEGILLKFPYFSFKGDFDFARSDVHLADGTPILLSRTGYTGEAGFELFLPEDKAEAVFRKILEKGALPCGLAARDSLRTGAVLPLSHQDIGPWPFVNHPWRFALPMDAEGAFTKSFHGADALRPENGPYTLPFIGFDPRRVDPHSAKVLAEGRDVGFVTTIVSDMAIGRVDGAVLSWASPAKPADWNPRGLACGFMRVEHPFKPGTELVLKDDRREIKVEVTADIRPDRTARKKMIFQ